MAVQAAPPPDRYVAGPGKARWLPDTVGRLAVRLRHRILKPAAVRRVAELAPDERILTYACAADEESVVATDAALHRLTGPAEAGAWSRWGWEQIARLTWDDRECLLAMTLLPSPEPSRVAIRFQSREPLIDLAIERLASTQLLRTTMILSGGGSVDVLVRQQPRTGERRWYLHPRDDVDPDDPLVAAELATALAGLRADTGL